MKFFFQLSHFKGDEKHHLVTAYGCLKTGNYNVSISFKAT